MDYIQRERGVKCNICEIGCQMSEGQQGKCTQYINRNGRICELYPDRYLVACPISIETMPLLHFYPRGKFLQISTTGCNFQCPGCVSTVIVQEMASHSKALHSLSPEELVNEAIQQGCLGLAFLMNDPLASFPSFMRAARAAKEKGLLVGCSSNAYFSRDSLEQVMEYLDFINVGVKGSSDLYYHRCGAPSAEPVWRNIEALYKHGVHIEVSSVLEKNGRDELRAAARRLADISPDIPLQVMRYIPLEKADPEMEPSIREAEEVCAELKGILKHVYLFNSPGTDYLDSACPSCGYIAYRRDFYGPMGARVRPGERMPHDNNCTQCGSSLNIRGSISGGVYQEGAFQGGYPFTRALEMIEAMLVAMQVRDQATVLQVWEDILVNNRLEELHRDIQKLPSYMEILRYCGQKAACEDAAGKLISYMEDKLQEVKNAVSDVGRRPRVYYAMGKPLFCIKGERMENQLVEAAGGHSVNRDIECSGRPGMKIGAEELNALNPEVIFISAFISSSVEDFIFYCRQENIDVEALRTRQIYTLPAPGWDFGSPRWILGLMYMTSILHPDLYQIDIMSEANEFYQRFYSLHFNPQTINRSFAKPDIHWKWQ